MQIIGAIVVGIGAIVWNAYVGSILWGWLVVPILGLPALTVFETFAVGLVTNVLGGGSHASDAKRKDEDSNARAWRIVLTSFVAPLVALGLGWIIRGFL